MTEETKAVQPHGVVGAGSKPALTPQGQPSAFRELALERIYESELNPRSHFDEAKITELSESIRAVGVIEPIVVRERRGKEKHLVFEIVAGARRHRAARQAGLTLVPALIRELDDTAALEIMVIENNQRDDVNPLEEAEGYQRLLKRNYTIERLAAKIGRSTKYIYDRLKLLLLIPEGKRLVLAGKMTAGHAILLARLKPKDQERALDVDEVNYNRMGGLWAQDRSAGDLFDDNGSKKNKDPLAKYDKYKPVSVRELEAWIDEHVRFEKKAPDPMLFPDTAATLNAAAEKKEKIIQITHNYSTVSEAKEGNTERIYHATSWKLADGSAKDAKACEKSVIGVIVVGPERGKAYRVCVHKDCPVHWLPEKKRKERLAGSNGSQDKRLESMKRQQDKEQKRWNAEQKKREHWRKLEPEIIRACAARIGEADFGVLSQVVDGCGDKTIRDALKAYGPPCMDSPEQVGRVLCLALLIEEVCRYQAETRFPKRAKHLGIDLDSILKTADREPQTKDRGPKKADTAAPAPKPAVQTSAKKPRGNSIPAGSPAAAAKTVHAMHGG